MVESQVIGITPAKHANEHKTTGSDPLADPIITTAHHTTHESGGADEVTGLMSISDGGETVVRATGALPTVWTDLDLSAIIGTKRCLVELAVRNNDGANGNVCLVRAKGATINYTGATNYSGTHFAAYPAGIAKYSRVISMTDTNGVVQIKGNAARSAEIFLISYSG